MPLIHITTNVAIPPEKQLPIKTQLGKDVTMLDKTEGWLMVQFTENAPLYFKGTAEPAAMVSVDLFGAAGGDAYSKLTAAVTRLLFEELAIGPERFCQISGIQLLGV